MTSIKQIEANRRNARLSTGPRTIEGRARSSRNAIRHGLTAETVVAPLEDLEDYTAFELAITADFEARTAVERELVLRLSNLLWRLRRATTIETGLLQVQAAMLAKQRNADRAESNECHTSQDDRTLGSQAVTRSSFQVKTLQQAHETEPWPSGASMVDLALSFLSVSNLDSQMFDRLGRYEASLWRQVGQVLFTLDRLRATSFRGCF
jgi:hypothetical protein